MSKKENNIEAIENKEVQAQMEQMEEPKKEGFITKSKGFAKKHGGKVLAVGGMLVATVVGIAVGKTMKPKSEDSGCNCENTDFEPDCTSDEVTE